MASFPAQQQHGGDVGEHRTVEAPHHHLHPALSSSKLNEADEALEDLRRFTRSEGEMARVDESRDVDGGGDSVPVLLERGSSPQPTPTPLERRSEMDQLAAPMPAADTKGEPQARADVIERPRSAFVELLEQGQPHPTLDELISHGVFEMSDEERLREFRAAHGYPTPPVSPLVRAADDRAASSSRENDDSEQHQRDAAFLAPGEARGRTSKSHTKPRLSLGALPPPQFGSSRSSRNPQRSPSATSPMKSPLLTSPLSLVRRAADALTSPSSPATSTARPTFVRAPKSASAVPTAASASTSSSAGAVLADTGRLAASTGHSPEGPLSPVITANAGPRKLRKKEPTQPTAARKSKGSRASWHPASKSESATATEDTSAPDQVLMIPPRSSTDEPAASMPASAPPQATTMSTHTRQGSGGAGVPFARFRSSSPGGLKNDRGATSSRRASTGGHGSANRRFASESSLESVSSFVAKAGTPEGTVAKAGTPEDRARSPLKHALRRSKALGGWFTGRTARDTAGLATAAEDLDREEELYFLHAGDDGAQPRTERSFEVLRSNVRRRQVAAVAATTAPVRPPIARAHSASAIELAQTPEGPVLSLPMVTSASQSSSLLRIDERDDSPGAETVQSPLPRSSPCYPLPTDMSTPEGAQLPAAFEQPSRAETLASLLAATRPYSSAPSSCVSLLELAQAPQQAPQRGRTSQRHFDASTGSDGDDEHDADEYDGGDEDDDTPLYDTDGVAHPPRRFGTLRASTANPAAAQQQAAISRSGPPLEWLLSAPKPAQRPYVSIGSSCRQRSLSDSSRSPISLTSSSPRPEWAMSARRSTHDEGDESSPPRHESMKRSGHGKATHHSRSRSSSSQHVFSSELSDRSSITSWTSDAESARAGSSAYPSAAASDAGAPFDVDDDDAAAAEDDDDEKSASTFRTARRAVLSMTPAIDGTASPVSPF